MTKALIGYSGFVGGALMRFQNFTHLYRSTNISEIHEKTFDLLICAGARAEKWKANQDPEADKRHIEDLIEHLSQAQAKKAVLISTVDVYAHPDQLNENDDTASESGTPYGRHRSDLEKFFARHFTDHLIVRLPALFGEGLKKNAVYDFLHNNQIEKIDSRAVFQFYDLEWLWDDIQKCFDHGLHLVNFATPPLSVREWVNVAFAHDFNNEIAPSPAFYDFRSRHSTLWNREDGYLYDRSAVLQALCRFVQNELARQETGA